MIISTSSKGLQTFLDSLHEYWNKWDLTVNIDKNKCMVLANGNLKVKPLSYDGNSLEMVQTYKYLGLIINRNGNFNKTIEDRIAKTTRASFVLKQALSSSCNVSVPLGFSHVII